MYCFGGKYTVPSSGDFSEENASPFTGNKKPLFPFENTNLTIDRDYGLLKRCR